MSAAMVSEAPLEGGGVAEPTLPSRVGRRESWPPSRRILTEGTYNVEFLGNVQWVLIISLKMYSLASENVVTSL